MIYPGLKNNNMNTYIKYERIAKKISERDIDELFRKIISDGCDLLYYKEKISEDGMIDVVLVVGKKRTIL